MPYMANRALYAGMAHNIIILLHIVIVCNVHSCGYSFDSGLYVIGCKGSMRYITPKPEGALHPRAECNMSP